MNARFSEDLLAGIEKMRLDSYARFPQNSLSKCPKDRRTLAFGNALKYFHAKCLQWNNDQKFLLMPPPSLVNLWSRTSSRCGVFGNAETFPWYLRLEGISPSSLEYFKTEWSLKPFGPLPRPEYGIWKGAGWWTMIRGSIDSSDTYRGICLCSWI